METELYEAREMQGSPKWMVVAIRKPLDEARRTEHTIMEGVSRHTAEFYVAANRLLGHLSIDYLKTVRRVGDFQ